MPIPNIRFDNAEIRGTIDIAPPLGPIPKAPVKVRVPFRPPFSDSPGPRVRYTGVTDGTHGTTESGFGSLEMTH